MEIKTGLPLPRYPQDLLLYGIDISSEMLARAHAGKTRIRLGNVVKLSVMDTEHIDFEDSSFDKVVAMHVATVVTDQERLVDEMRSVCEPDGRIIFVNHFRNPNPLHGSFENLIAPLSGPTGPPPGFLAGPVHKPDRTGRNRDPAHEPVPFLHGAGGEERQAVRT